MREARGAALAAEWSYTLLAPPPGEHEVDMPSHWVVLDSPGCYSPLTSLHCQQGRGRAVVGERLMVSQHVGE